MNRRQAVAVLFIVALVAPAAISLVSAGTAESGSVWTTSDAAGLVNAGNFNPGARVYLSLSTAPDGTTADITVVDEANHVVAGPWTNVAPGTSVESFVPPNPGYYWINVDGKPSCQIAVATFFVVPESVLGALTAIVGAVAAFGAFTVVKKTRKINER